VKKHNILKLSGIYLYLVPATILMGFGIFIPIINVFINSLYKCNAVGKRLEFVGFQNFLVLFQNPLFLQVMKQTLIWTVSMVVIATIIALIAALVLNRRFPGRTIARIIIFLPWGISFVFTSILWKLIYDQFYGHVNGFLTFILQRQINTPWLGGAQTAFPALIWVGIFLTIPFTTIMILSGLQSIPQELLEAANIDGAGPFQGFSYVVFPLLKPVLVVATVINVIYIFNSFPIIWILTMGGPANLTDTITTYIYKLAFSYLDMGSAAALSVVGCVVLMSFSFLFVIFTSKEVF
jgi:multiple sugar transport system permease protein